jgi:hypothetical protein
MNKKEIIPGFFVGDTVILERQTEKTESQGLKLGTLAVVSEADDAESLDGWKVVDYEKRFKEALDKMSEEEVSSLFNRLKELGHIKTEK